MKALTLHQPWASLIALGVKTIETRSWATKYRGPLLIHAGVKRPSDLGTPTLGEYRLRAFGRTGWAMEGPGLPPYRSTPRLEGYLPPFGKIVASCTLADVVPMVASCDWPGGSTQHLVVTDTDLQLHARFVQQSVEDQRPYGDFAPGRYAWLLEDVKPTTERCPACRGYGDDPLAVVQDDGQLAACAACDGAKVCEPIPAKGKQGLWDWAP